MTIQVPSTDVVFVTPSEEEKSRYDTVREIIREIQKGGGGTMATSQLIVSALIAEDPESTVLLEFLVDAVRESGLDGRDLASIVSDRPFQVQACWYP